MAKSQNKWLERYTDGGLYIPLEGTSYVVRQQISKPRTYAKGGLGDGDGDKKPIYVTDPNDPRLKAYQDSLNTYNITNKIKESLKKIKYTDPKSSKDYYKIYDYNNPRIKPISHIWTEDYVNQNNLIRPNPSMIGIPVYKKPVQPVILKKEPKQEEPKNKNIKVYTDLNKFKVANQAYQDSVALYNASNQFRVNNLLKQGFKYDSEDFEKNIKLTPSQKKEWQKSFNLNTKKGLQKIIQKGNDGQIDTDIGGNFDKKPQYDLMHGTIAPVEIAPLYDSYWRHSKYLYDVDNNTYPGSEYDKNQKNFRMNPNYGKPNAKDKNGEAIRNFFTIPIYKKPVVKPVLEEKKLTDQSFNFPGELTYTKKELTPFEDEVVSFSDYTDSINKIKDSKTKTEFKKSENNNIKNTIKQVKRKLFPGYRLPYQYQSARVPLFENGGWLNQYEEGGYADDSAVLNTEGQEVNTMQFALPTVPTFNFGNGNGNGDGDGEDPKDKKKSKDKKTDTRTIGQKRHDALEAAKTKILKTESPENKKKMDMLYSTTIAAENTYGYDPNAYGRKKQTRSPMSIDNIALDELFNPKGEKNRYTLQQKLNFDLLRSLGLPTDKAKLKELLETDDAYAGLGVAKTLYYNEGALKNLPNPTDTAAYINLYLNEYNKSGALKYQKRNELIDNITNKMRAQGKRKTKTIKPVVKNKTTK